MLQRSFARFGSTLAALASQAAAFSSISGTAAIANDKRAKHRVTASNNGDANARNSPLHGKSPTPLVFAADASVNTANFSSSVGPGSDAPANALSEKPSRSKPSAVAWAEARKMQQRGA